MIDVTEKYDVKSKSIATVSQKFELKFPVNVKDGDVVQMPEDLTTTSEQKAVSKWQTMAQTIKQRQAEDQSQNWPMREDDGKEIEMVEETQCRENLVESFLVVSLTMMFNKSSNWAVSAVTDEIINGLHQENFNLAVFKQMIKNSGEFHDINQDVIGGCKNL